MTQKPMKLSKQGLDLLREFEGCKLVAYRCQAGVWTIGVGHTATAKPGMNITTERAMDLLKADVAKFEMAVNRLVLAQLTQNQFDALVSFVFNVGVGAFEKSTLLKKLNANDYIGAADQFPKWVRAGGVVSKGLERRRSVERAFFLRRDNPD